MPLLNGFLEVKLLMDKKIFYVGFTGNTGISEVKERFDSSFGEGSFDKIRQVADEENGIPGYMYSMIVGTEKAVKALDFKNKNQLYKKIYSK